MNTLIMMIEKPKMNMPEGIPENGGASRAPDKKSRKELMERGMRERAKQGQAPRKEAKLEITYEKLSEQELAEFRNLIKNASPEERKAYFDEFASLVSPKEMEKIRKEIEGGAEAVPTEATAETTQEEAPSGVVVEESPEVSAPEESPAPKEVPASETQSPQKENAAAEVQPEKSEPEVEDQTPPLEISKPAQKFETYEDLEEAFGRGDIIRIEEFLQEKARLRPTPPPSPSEEGFYEIVKKYVADKEKRRREGVFGEEETRRGRRFRSKPRRARATEEAELIQKEHAFPPTEEMRQITQEIKSAVDKAGATWERLTTYKRLDARTFKMIERLDENFRQLEILRNKFSSAEAKARAEFETQQKKERASGSPEIRMPYKPTIGERMEIPPYQITPETAPQALKRLSELRGKERSREKQEKRKREMERKERKQKGAFLGKDQILAEYREKIGEEFSRGDIKLPKFNAKRDLINRMRTGNALEELDTAFAEDIVNLEEYKKLKSKLR